MLPFNKQMIYSLEEFRAQFLDTKFYFLANFKYEYPKCYDKVMKTLFLQWENISTLITLLLEFNKNALDVIIPHLAERTF